MVVNRDWKTHGHAQVPDKPSKAARPERGAQWEQHFHEMTLMDSHTTRYHRRPPLCGVSMASEPQTEVPY